MRTMRSGAAEPGSFAASKGAAKFNTFEVKDAAGASVIAFNASELADTFSAAATRVPEISEPPIWRDPSQPLKDRINDLIRRMSLAEKVAQLQNGRRRARHRAARPARL